jgi:cytidylate kinase
MIIAIDGPAAAGKGTLARRLAEALGLPYLDTGLLYRATALRLLEAGGTPAEAAASIGLADLTHPDLRSEKIGKTASAVAAIPEVRAALLDYQRQFGAQHGAVLDGRDIGTVVFPNADVKIFVTASLEARATRRHAEILRRGGTATLDEVTADLAARDHADSTRATAPTAIAPDAILFDTTTLDIDTAFEQALQIIKERKP